MQLPPESPCIWLKMYIHFHVDFNGTWIFSTVFLKIFNYQPSFTSPVRAELLHADGRTDRTKLTVAFGSFANAPKTPYSDMLCDNSWCWWPCGLRRRSADARLLGTRVRIRLWERMFVPYVCCVVATSATSWSLVQRSPTGCVCDLEASTMRRPRPQWGWLATKKW